MIPIIAFSGSSATLKTTLGRKLAQELGWKFVSFGDYVREQAKERGLSNPSREDLQIVGQQLVEADILGFCRAVLETAHFSPGDRLIVDGVRHTEVLRAISEISGGQPIRLIYLHASMIVREARYSEHNQRGTLHQIDAHQVERQTNHEIRQLANLVVDTGSDVDKSYSQILGWIRRDCPELLPTQSK